MVRQHRSTRRLVSLENLGAILGGSKLRALFQRENANRRCISLSGGKIQHSNYAFELRNDVRHAQILIPLVLTILLTSSLQDANLALCRDYKAASPFSDVFFLKYFCNPTD